MIIVVLIVLFFYRPSAGSWPCGSTRMSAEVLSGTLPPSSSARRWPSFRVRGLSTVNHSEACCPRGLMAGAVFSLLFQEGPCGEELFGWLRF